MTKIIYGSSAVTMQIGGQRAFGRFASPAVFWGGDESFVKSQSTDINGGVIDETTAGTAGRIHLIQRVYDPALETSTWFCVTADTWEENGIEYVDVFYGSSIGVRQTQRTTRNGITGYWFELVHDATEAIEERTIYAELVPANSETIVPRVVSKKVRIGTPTYVDLDPSDCIASGLHDIIKLDPSGSNDNHVYRLSTGIYYLESRNVPPQDLPNDEVWVEVRSQENHHAEIRVVNSIPDSSYSYARRDYQFIRVNHLTLRDLTFNFWEYAAIQIWGPYNSGGIVVDVIGQLSFDGCTIIDPQSTDATAPAGLIDRGLFNGSITNWYSQNLFRFRTSGEEYYTDIHRSKIRALVAGGAHEYFDCYACCEWDTFYWDRSVDSTTVNGFRSVLPYAPNDNSPSLETLRFYTALLGSQDGFYDVNGDYNYSFDDLQNISEMTYEVASVVDKTDPKEFTVGLVETPTKYPLRYNPSSGWAGNTKLYDFDIYVWRNGQALTLDNRKFLQKPKSEGTSLVISWLDDDDILNASIVNTLKFYRTDGSDVESGGFVFDDHFDLQAGDRISVVYWNHPDVLQTTSSNPISNAVFHNVVSVFDQQLLMQSDGNALDVIFNSCLFLEPDLNSSDYFFQIQEPLNSRMAFKWCTFDDYLFNIETDKLVNNQTGINIIASVCDNIEGESDTPQSEEWSGVRVVDSVYKELNYFQAGIGSTAGSSTYLGDGGDLDAYGVAISGGDAIKTSNAQRLPIGIDGGTRDGQIGAVSQADITYVPNNVPFFRTFPIASEINATAGATLSLKSHIVEWWSNTPVSATYEWWTSSGVISGQTSSTLDTTGRAGDRIWCLISYGDLKHWVDFGIVQ